jgi:hypothetical protein
MDDPRFDTLVRSFGTAYSRRRFSRLLGGLTAGGVLTALGAPEAAAGSRPGGAPCKRGRQCLTGKCAGPKGSKRCTCSQNLPLCKQPTNSCQEANCNTVSQRCETTNKPDDDPCGAGLNCMGGACGNVPNCWGQGETCGSISCCSGSCDTSRNPSICTCSGLGMPCHNNNDDQCCPSAPGIRVACIGFYCGGCRAKGQPCDANGGGCCGRRLLCANGLCKDSVIG